MSNNLYIVNAILKDGSKVEDKILAKNIAEARKKSTEHWNQPIQKLEHIKISVKNYEGWKEANCPKTNNLGEWENPNEN